MSVDERNPLRYRPRILPVQPNARTLHATEEERPLTERENQEQDIKERNNELIADRMARAMRWVRGDD